MRRRVVVALAAVGILAAALLLARAGAGRLYEDIILDSRTSPLPCERRPSIAQAERVLAAHGDAVGRIQTAGASLVYLDTMTCPGRGTLVIAYDSHQDRRQIERLIGGDTFFGIPYSLDNV